MYLIVNINLWTEKEENKDLNAKRNWWKTKVIKSKEKYLR
jgi:hypothetical protein